MSIAAALSIADQLALARALTSDHHVRISVSLLDLNENYIAPLSSLLYDGQVTISADADITRSANLVLFDPERVLTFDGDNPVDGALYYDKMIAMTYCVWMQGWTKSIDIPIFRGPIHKLKRSGMLVSLDCYGKELLSKTAIWTPRSYKKGSNKTATIKDLLSAGSGERKFDLQATTAKLPNTLALVRESITWDQAKGVASGMNMQLFYDGRGTARLRPFPTAKAWTFRNRTGGSIVTKPDLDFDLENAKNLIVIQGGKPKGSTRAVEGVATAEPSHPLNHNRIGRNGVKRVLLETLSYPTITSKTAATRKAKQILDSRLRQGLNFQMTTLPIVFLEENDLAEVNMFGQYAFDFRIKEMTIPLVGGPTATIGTRRNLTLKRRS